MDGSQVTGASSSYARKYALNGMFAIDDTKDSDATNTGDKIQPTEYRCENCGKPFKGLRMSDGTILTAEEVYEKAKLLTVSHYAQNAERQVNNSCNHLFLILLKL